MKILIISGFLGSGKTTFIKEMVKKTKKQFVIVENEFGKLGLDLGINRRLYMLLIKFRFYTFYINNSKYHKS